MPLLAELPMLDTHPKTSIKPEGENSSPKLDTKWLRQLCLDTGADDVGFVDIARPEIEKDRADILNTFPRTKTLISFVIRMNREPIRSPARSIANLEFHHTGDEVNEVARNIVKALQARGIRAINPAMGFPWKWTDSLGRSGWCHTNRSLWRRAWDKWAFIGTSFIRSSGTSFSLGQF